MDHGILQELAKKAGIERVGVCPAAPPKYLRGRLKRRAAEGRVTPFEEKNIRRRLLPELLLPGCRSIITVALPYSPAVHRGPALPPGPRGKVARCARGPDYHGLVTARAEKLAALLKVNAKTTFDYRVLSDRSPLVERDYAFHCKLGSIGENCTLLSPVYGSYTALGTILVNRELKPGSTVPAGDACLHCGSCREACPTGALLKPYVIDPFRCLSYLTQAPGLFPREMRAQLGNRVYGCDTCQEACPANVDAAAASFPEAAVTLFPAEPFLIPLLEISGSEFDLTIGLTSAGWRGKTTLQRNAVLALGNCGDRGAVKSLSRLLENDPRALIRAHSAWALGRLGGPRASFYLERASSREPDETVKAEVNLALGGAGES